MTQFTTGNVAYSAYRIVQFLGQDVLGERYLTDRLSDARPATLKADSRDRLSSSLDIFERMHNVFSTQFELGRQIRHVCLAETYDFFQTQDTVALVEEFPQAGTLEDQFREARVAGQGFPTERAIRIGIHVAMGLAALHDRDVVHRCLVPSHIGLDREGNSKVFGYGWAQIRGIASLATSQMVDLVPELPAYMSPEQAHNERLLAPPSDIYALGVILFEALTLRNYRTLRPGTSIRSLRPDAPAWLDGAVMRMLDQNPGNRFWDGKEAMQALLDGLAKELETHRSQQRITFVNQIRSLHAKGAWGEALDLAQQALRHFPDDEELTGLVQQGVAGKLKPTIAEISAHLAGERWETALQQTNAALKEFPGYEELQKLARAADAGLKIARNTVSFQQIGLRVLGQGIRHCLAFSPDGRLLAVGTDLGVFAYSSSSLSPVWRWTPGITVHSVTFAPDNRTLAVGCTDRTARILGVQDGKVIREIAGLPGPVYAVAISRDGEYLAAGSNDNQVRLWRLQTSEIVATLDCDAPYGGSPRTVQHILFAPDSATLIAVAERSVYIWAFKDRRLLRRIENPEWIHSFSLAPDGHTFAIGKAGFSGVLINRSPKDQFATIQLGDLRSGELAPEWRTAETSTDGVAFSPDGRMIASVSGRNIYLWDRQTAKVVRTLKGIDTSMASCALVYSSDGKVLAATPCGSLRVWDLRASAPIEPDDGEFGLFACAAITPDQGVIALGTSNGDIELRHLQDAKRIVALEGGESPISQIAFSANWRVLAALSSNRVLSVWDLQDALAKGDRRASGIFGSARPRPLVRIQLPQDKNQPGRTLFAISPSGDLLAAASGGASAGVYDGKNGKPVWTFEAATQPIAALAFLPNGRTLVCAAKGGAISFWDINQRKLVKHAQYGSGQFWEPWCIKPSPDGRWMATAGVLGGVEVWNVETLEAKSYSCFPFRTTVSHAAVAMCFSADSSRLIVGNIDCTIRILDARSGELLKTFRGHTEGIQDLALTQDGKTLLSVSQDQTIRFWPLG